MVLPGTDLFDRLLDVGPAAVIAADLRGRLLVFNRAAEALLGYGAAEALQHLHVTDLYHRPEDARRVLMRIRAQDNALTPMDITLRARNGELIPVRLRAALLHEASGAVVGTVGAFEDRRETDALSRRLEDAAGQVLASERRAANIAVASEAAHEMAQPLTAAMGNLEMLLMTEDLAPDTTRRLERAYEQLERLKRIVHEFSRFTTRPAKGEGSR